MRWEFCNDRKVQLHDARRKANCGPRRRSTRRAGDPRSGAPGAERITRRLPVFSRALHRSERSHSNARRGRRLRARRLQRRRLDRPSTSPAPATPSACGASTWMRCGCEIGRSFSSSRAPTTLRRQSILVEGGQTVYVYFRQGQRRCARRPTASSASPKQRPACSSRATPRRPARAIAVTQAALDANTVVVQPWWLYRDYQSPTPADRYAATWQSAVSEFRAGARAAQRARRHDAHHRDPNLQRRSAGRSDGHGLQDRPQSARGGHPSSLRTALAASRPTAASPRAHGGEMVACNSNTAIMSSTECGCGVGLERCMPGGSAGLRSAGIHHSAFASPRRRRSHRGRRRSAVLLGSPLVGRRGAALHRYAARRGSRFSRDAHRQVHGHQRSARAVLPCASRPRRAAATATTSATSSPRRSSIPPRCPPICAFTTPRSGSSVADRGPHASGLLTMPVFLTKFGSRRGRAHVLYSTFLCREFVAGDIKLEPSTEPNLMKRSGCNTCHVALEPLAAYFSRVQESDWTYLPGGELSHQDDHQVRRTPIRPRCRARARASTIPRSPTRRRASCAAPTPSDENANAGPAGIAQHLVTAQEFPGCIAQKL